MGKAIRDFCRRHEIRLDRWYLSHGRWWMVQACFDCWFSLGIHIDLKRRTEALTGKRFGPYLDLHLGWVIISLGFNPVYSGRWHQFVSIGRGGHPTEER